MLLPVLDIPTPSLSRRPKPYLRPRKLNRWAADLPSGNVADASRALLAQLHIINHSHYDAGERMKLMATLLPVSHRLVFSLLDSLNSASLSHQGQLTAQASLASNLLAELATGYKLVVSDLALWDQDRAGHNTLLQEALYFAVKWLCLRLVVTYAVYQPEPNHAWRELNQLYQFSERFDMSTVTVDDNYEGGDTAGLAATTDRLYKQIILLALSEPYKLMHNEVWQLYSLVGNWAEVIQFLPAESTPAYHEYVIDLGSDAEPRLCSDEAECDTEDCYIIDIGEAQRQLDRLVENALRSSRVGHYDDSPSLQLRQRRDMLLRLARSWSNKAARKDRRNEHEEQVEVILGLNACHFFSSQRADFTPEMDELRLKTLENAGSSNVTSPKDFAAAFRDALQKDRRHSHSGYQINPLTQRNRSSTGMALCGTPGSSSPPDANVGELVAYRSGKSGSDAWRIGVIRWLRSEPETGTDMGVMQLARTGVPIAVRALQGAGEGTDYFRSLLIPESESLQQSRSLIVPGTIFDIGTRLAVNEGSKLFYVRLTRLLQSTQEFSLYEFADIDAPPPRL